MWQIHATFPCDACYLLLSLLCKVLCHLVLAVLAFIWACSRGEPKTAIPAAGAGVVQD